MRLPLPLHTLAQRTAALSPLPPVIKSTIAPAVWLGSASAMPPGSVIGHARKQSPQRVQAVEIASARVLNSSRNPVVSLITLILYLTLSCDFCRDLSVRGSRSSGTVRRGDTWVVDSPADIRVFPTSLTKSRSIRASGRRAI